MRIRRAAIALISLAAIYAIAAELGHGRLPDRIWMGSHYVENIQLLPTWRSLAEEGAFLIESRILVDSVVVSTRRVLLGLAFFRFTPALALLPLYVVWFGYGEASKVLLIATGVAVVTLLGAHQGVREVPRTYLDAAASLGAPRALVFRRIILPLAFPAIFTSVRVATALAWVTIVVAELIDAKMPSLGYLLALSGAYPRVPQMLIAIATVGALVLVFDTIALLLHNRATRWMRRTA